MRDPTHLIIAPWPTTAAVIPSRISIILYLFHTVKQGRLATVPDGALSQAHTTLPPHTRSLALARTQSYSLAGSSGRQACEEHNQRNLRVGVALVSVLALVMGLHCMKGVIDSQMKRFLYPPQEISHYFVDAGFKEAV
ncbi:hypothetical protein ElyMa_000047800 [Elysia marginata]|uniref:Uncharacterized protein n=1 Tax=Elysia marginata TaxID=1093978 RepID=A0AAV4EE52_9GAST|nr:hypothetical protein ElyMa_000047800 [Elysia marginata]